MLLPGGGDGGRVQVLAQEFEIDFLSLSYCREADDVRDARRCVCMHAAAFFNPPSSLARPFLTAGARHPWLACQANGMPSTRMHVHNHTH